VVERTTKRTTRSTTSAALLARRAGCGWIPKEKGIPRCFQRESNWAKVIGLTEKPELSLTRHAFALVVASSLPEEFTAEADHDYGKPIASVCDELSGKRHPQSYEDRTSVDSLGIA